MRGMTHRERLLTAINCKEPDRVPLDFGSTIATTIIWPGYNRLKEHLGFQHDNKTMLFRQGSVIPDDSILERFDIDTRGIVLGDYKGGPGKVIDENTVIDIWQTTWKRAPEGHYINIDGPFQKREPSIDDLDKFEWPDPDNPGLYEGLADKAAKLRNNTDCAIVMNMPVGIIHQGQFMRGFMEWLTDLYTNPDYICRMSDLIMDIWIKIAVNVVNEVRDNVDVFAWGDDLAMQEATLFNHEIYRKIIKPRHKEMIEAIKSRGNYKVWYHSCGSVYDLINDLIDIGVDTLNPIQVNAKNMDPLKLKTEFGNRISFWGGIDTQHVLPFGTQDEVRNAVRLMIDSLGKGGGYIVNSVHNIQPDVPPENIVAMFDEAKSYGVYNH